MTNLYLIVSDIAVVIGGCPGSPADRKSTRLNSSHSQISYAVFCLKKKKKDDLNIRDHTNIQQRHAQQQLIQHITTTRQHPITHLYLESIHAPFEEPRHEDAIKNEL